MTHPENVTTQQAQEGLLTMAGTHNKMYLPKLQEQLRTATGVVPFVGAGLSAHLGYPSWGAFLAQTANGFPCAARVQEALARWDYEEAAEEILRDFQPDPFHDTIATTFGPGPLQGKQPIPGAVSLLPKLAKGPVLTTNYDPVLETVFQEQGQAFEKLIWGGPNVDTAMGGMHGNRRVLVKLHGDAGDRTNRVLTRSDYEREYGKGKAVNAKKPLPKLLRQLMQGRPLLFLGCGLNQDRTLEVLEKVAELNTVEHYAILERPATDAAYHAKRRNLGGALKIKAIWYPHGQHQYLEPILRWLLEIPNDHPKPKPSKKLPAPDRIEAAELIGDSLLEQVRLHVFSNKSVVVLSPRKGGMTCLTEQLKKHLEKEFPERDVANVQVCPNHGQSVNEFIEKFKNQVPARAAHQRPLIAYVTGWAKDERQTADFAGPYNEALAQTLRARVTENPNQFCMVAVGGYPLYLLTYGAGALSPLNNAEKVYWTDWTARQVHSLMDRIQAGLWSLEDAQQVWELTGGHPYLVKQLLNQWVQAPEQPWVDFAGLPESGFVDFLGAALSKAIAHPATKERLQECLASSNGLPHHPYDPSDRGNYLFYLGLLRKDGGRLKFRCEPARQLVKDHFNP